MAAIKLLATKCRITVIACITTTRQCDNASIVQGSAVGPVSHVVIAGDLTPLTPGNVFCKYADDTYLVIPASNVD